LAPDVQGAKLILSELIAAPKFKDLVYFFVDLPSRHYAAL
jgi:hypothetical protein